MSSHMLCEMCPWHHNECDSISYHHPDSNVHGTNMGPTWGWQDPGGRHVGPMNFAIWAASRLFTQPFIQAHIKNPSKLLVTGLCEGNSAVTGEFPAQRASNVENVSIWSCRWDLPMPTWVPLHQRVYIHNSISTKYHLFCAQLNHSKVITTKFCTWCAVSRALEQSGFLERNNKNEFWFKIKNVISRKYDVPPWFTSISTFKAPVLHTCWAWTWPSSA